MCVKFLNFKAFFLLLMSIEHQIHIRRIKMMLRDGPKKPKERSREEKEKLNQPTKKNGNSFISTNYVQKAFTFNMLEGNG